MTLPPIRNKPAYGYIRIQEVPGLRPGTSSLYLPKPMAAKKEGPAGARPSLSLYHLFTVASLALHFSKKRALSMTARVWVPSPMRQVSS